MNPPDLIRIARRLSAGAGRGRPRQTDLCRAVSAAYYAMFHTMARCCADMLVGKTRSHRSQPAWEQTYRALEHGYARSQCDNRSVMVRFPQCIQDFGKHFVDMQRHRHRADYAPVTEFTRSGVAYFIDQAERRTASFNKASVKDRRAFAIHVLLRKRP